MFSTPATIRKAVSTFVSPAKALIHRRKTEKSTTTSIFDLVSAVDPVKDVKPAKQSNNKKSAARVLAYLNQLHYDDVPELVMQSLPLIPAETRSANATQIQIPADAPPCYETLLLDEITPPITTPVLEPSSPTPSVESVDALLTPPLDVAAPAAVVVVPAPAPTPVTDAVSVHSVSVSDDEDSGDIFEDANDEEEDDDFAELLLHVNVLTTSPASTVVDSDSDSDDEVIDVEEDSDEEEEDEEEETTERVNCIEHSPVITMEESRDFMLAKGRFGRKPLHPRVAFLRRHAD